MKLQLTIFLCILALHSYSLSAQNLVQDPGFELTKTNYWEITTELQENMQHWRSPTMTSSDVLMKSDSFEQISLYNYNPRNGNGVGGIFTYTHPTDTKITNNQFAYREYLASTPIDSPSKDMVANLQLLTMLRRKVGPKTDGLNSKFRNFSPYFSDSIDEFGLDVRCYLIRQLYIRNITCFTPKHIQISPV